jgi:hypothetical protein
MRGKVKVRSGEGGSGPVIVETERPREPTKVD